MTPMTRMVLVLRTTQAGGLWGARLDLAATRIVRLLLANTLSICLQLLHLEAHALHMYSLTSSID
jgi:hypothetical protein